MDNFILSFNVVMPLFLTMLFGYLLKLTHFLDDEFLAKLNRLSFNCFLPIMLFMNVYGASGDLSEVFNFKLLAYASGAVLVCTLLLCLIIPKIEPENRRRGVLIQGIYRSNFAIFGIPIANSLYGSEGSAVTAIVIAVVVPFFNILAVIVLESFRSGKTSLKTITKQIIKNPLIIGSVLGILFLLTGLKLPIFLEKTVGDISKIATPLALIILGGSFHFSSVKTHLKQLILGVTGRLVLVPLIFIPIAMALGFRDVELATLIALFGAPTAVSSYTMAQQMGGDSELADHLVVFSALFSAITMFLWIYLAKSLGGI